MLSRFDINGGVLLGLGLSLDSGLVDVMDVLGMLLLDLLEGRLEVIVDAVELGRLGEVHDEFGLQDDSAVEVVVLGVLGIVSLQVCLVSLGLEPGEGHILVLEEALGDETHSQERLVVNSVELNRVETIFQEILRLDDEGLEESCPSHNYHVVLLHELLVLLIVVVLLLGGSLNLVGDFFLVFLDVGLRTHL